MKKNFKILQKTKKDRMVRIHNNTYIYQLLIFLSHVLYLFGDMYVCTFVYVLW